ncbi:radical SAM protein [bacterium]|nr:radical SAM protein [bacterium]
MRVVASTGREDVAVAYVAETAGGRLVEFTEAVQPSLSREQKWVLIVSSLFGCPARCAMCDAGGSYEGKMTAGEIFEQIDFLVDGRYPDRRVPAAKFKIQFARVGEPSLNPAVLDVLRELPRRYDAPGLLPAVSSIAPVGCDEFFERLRDIKNRLYPNGRFQLQFSIHTTDESLRDQLIPMRKWGFDRIGDYGAGFRAAGDRKVTLNFALARGAPVDPDVLLRWFDPLDFLIKITPINPTHRAVMNGIVSHVDPGREEAGVEIARLRSAGYDVLLSIGELEENRIGSNCGQYIQRHLEAKRQLGDGYACVDRARAAVLTPGKSRE